MLPDTHPLVDAELSRREEVKAVRERGESDDDDQSASAKRRKKEKDPHDSLVEKDTGKWKSMHIDLAEKRTKLS